MLAAFPQLSAFIHEERATADAFAFGEKRVQTLDATGMENPGAARLFLPLNGSFFALDAASFFQVNTAQAEKLYDVIRALALEGTTKRRTLLDLYCGTGTIGLHLARDFGRVIGVESNESAIRDARQNAEKNNYQSARFHVAKAEDIPLDALPKDIDCIIIDPPRTGCDPALLAKIRTLAPGTLIYVSCDPATLARDLVQLASGEKPAYAIKAIQPVDLFGRTGHVETVVLMSREEQTKT